MLLTPSILLPLLLVPTLPGPRGPGPQGSGPQSKAEPQRVSTPIGLVRVAEASEAKQHLALLQKHVLPLCLQNKRAEKSKRKKRRSAKPLPGTGLVVRLETVEALQEIQHKSFVKPILIVLQHDPSDAVRTKAARALLAQPRKQVLPIAEKLIQDKDILERGSITATLIQLLQFYGTRPTTWKKLYKRFPDMGSNAQIALCKAVGARKDYEALPLLLSNLDPPGPGADIHHASNPPASYWKKRWNLWQAFKPSLQEALQALLGKSFQTSKKAREYIRSQGGIQKLRKKLHG